MQEDEKVISELVGKVVVGSAYLGLVIAIAFNADRLKTAATAAIIVTALALALGFMDPVKALPYVDLDVIGLIVLASALSWAIEDSGLAMWIVAKSLKLTGGSIRLVVIVIGMVSLLLSLWLENITVVIIMAPIVFAVSRALGVNPIPLLIVSALGSNLSGSALLCGDPQAAIVASAYGLTFTDFIIYNWRPSMFFIVIASSIAGLLLMPTIIKIADREFYTGVGGEARACVQEPRFSNYMMATLLAMAVKATLLSLRRELGFNLTTCAALAVIPLLLIYWRRVARNLREFFEKVVDIKLVGFYIAMFYLVGFLDGVGLTGDIAKAIEHLSGGSSLLVPLVLIGIGAASSSFIDNVPLVAAFVPVVTKLSTMLGIDKVVLAWAMLLGVTIGGGGSFIGCMAAYAAVRIGERETGRRITFAYYAKMAIPFTIVALLAGTATYYATYLSYLTKT